ncbi:MAG: rod shape-determining protein MreC [Oscillospiraceae bacterium]|nr:rod shape-determining protein MreC [Oscillospiraceae bacterium]
MRNIFRSRAFILLVFTFFCLVLIVLTSNDIGDMEWVGDTVSAPFAPLSSLVDSITASVNKNVRTFGDVGLIFDENDELKARITELERENRELLAYREKLVMYQDALNLKGRFSDYSLIGGNVITRDVGNWFDVFKIDIGSRAGVAKDLPVVTSNMALIGRTISVSVSTSKVITLIDEECVVSGWIAGHEGGAVVVRGDLTLKEQGYCRIDLFSDELEVKPGDIVETSGIGGIFPRGIEIGTVLTVMQTGNGLMRYAVVDPFADIKRIDEVFILVGHGSDMEAGEVEK